jgi:S1-C subfamily serine protease
MVRRFGSFLVLSALSVALLLCRDGRAEEPGFVEVSRDQALVTFLGGGQGKAAQGDRFQVAGTQGSYYLVLVGDKKALIAINDVSVAKSPSAPPTGFVVTTARASIVMRVGFKRTPSETPQGTVFEVLGRPSLGNTLYVLMKDGHTGEIAASLVRNARPNEVPPLPQLEREIPLPRLGCEISLDKDRTVIVEYVYPRSFGERIGLTRFMKILEVNGTPIHSAADYDKASRLLGGRLRLLVQQRGLDYPEMIQYGF